MPLTKAQKTDLLKILIDQMKASKSIVFANFQGMSVKDIKALRKQMKEKGVVFKVAKKTLIKLAAKEVGYQEIPQEILQGPIGAAFSMEDEIIGAKLIHTFAKKNKNLKLRGALFEGRILSLAETMQLAMLPGKEELIGKFIYLVKYPISGFHGVLYNTIAGFVRALNAIKEKGHVSAGQSEKAAA